MIGVSLQGGLGNILFQTAFIESLGVKYGRDVCYTNLDNTISINNGYRFARHTEEYASVFPNIDWKKNQNRLLEITRNKHIPFSYVDIVPEDGINYVGYFQSERYFINRAFVTWLFQPAKWVKEILVTEPHTMEGITCSIHVRRQDYLTLSDYHYNLGMDYYEKAIETMKPFNVDKYLVFSDDIEWCKQNFTGNEFVFIQNKEYIDFFLFSQCTHNIIANSSFSWLGAWCGDPLDRVVIAPRHWFGTKGQKSDDIIPQRWIQL